MEHLPVSIAKKIYCEHTKMYSIVKLIPEYINFMHIKRNFSCNFQMIEGKNVDTVKSLQYKMKYTSSML